MVIAHHELCAVVPENTPRLLGHAPHTHGVPELIYVVSGRAAIEVHGSTHRLAARESLWLTPDVLHSTRYEDDGMAFGALLSPGTRPAGQFEFLPPMPRLDSLLRTIMAAAPSTEEQIAPFRDALDTLLRPLAESYFALQRPVHPVGRRVADTDPADTATLQELARREHISLRQLQRIFVEETGLSAARWRRRARLNAAISIIRAGRGLGTAARSVGYANPSRLLRALSRETGESASDLTRDPLIVIQRFLT